MAATYTFDVFSSLDGFGSASGGDLELIESRTVDRNIQELHVPAHTARP